MKYLISVFCLIFCFIYNQAMASIASMDPASYAKARGLTPTTYFIEVDSKSQSLKLFHHGQLACQYKISTSKRGMGQESGSKKTPYGLHKIVEKIGAKAPRYAIFKHRTFTGYIWQRPNENVIRRKDYIVTRILRLAGLEPGLNQGRNKRGAVVDSLKRAIYIHGTTVEERLGYPQGIGCIHMHTDDLIELFERVPVGTLVLVK